MPAINNVTRFLDSRKIVYRAYEMPAEKLGAWRPPGSLMSP